MKPKNLRHFTSGNLIGLAATTFFVHLGATNPLFAASQIWSGATNATWNTAGNWVGLAVPGNATPANTNDVATFNSPLASGTVGGSLVPVTIDTNRTIGGITFDTANVGAYQIGTTTQLQLSGLLAATNLTQMTASVTSPQVIAAPIYIRNASGSNNPSYIFRNNAVSPSATLSLTGLQTWNSSNSRPAYVTLDGSNTGDNIISGVINNPANAQPGNLLTKNGLGTWILSGANTFSGSSSTGVAINAGILSARHAQALGAGGNNNKVAINNGGTLQLANSITLIDSQRLNLNQGGTIQSSGSNATNAPIAVSTAATSATISTVNASDVFTIGNADNDMTGGTVGTTLTHVTGPGMIVLGHSNNYAGGWSINSGTVQLGNNGGLGAAPSTSVTFGAGSTGTLQLNGFSPTITGLSTNVSPGTAVVENGTTGTSLLTVNGGGTFAGTLRDGVAGNLALTKGGAGVLALSGDITYTGPTIVAAGTLLINSTVSTPTMAVNSGAVLGGTGTIPGAVTQATGSHLAPGVNGVGTLTVDSLSLTGGVILDYEFKTGPPANDLTVVSAPHGLTLSGGGFNLYQEGTITSFNTVGIYNLIQYSGVLGGSAANLSVLNPDPTRNYAISSDGTNVKVNITEAIISSWGLPTGGSWASPTSWTGAGVPDGSGATALFGSALLTPGTVILDGTKTAGTLSFNNLVSYTISPSTTESLVLDNTVNSGQAQIIGTNGSHGITAPVVLNSNAAVSVANPGDTITMAGVVSGSGSISKGGPGTLALNGANTYAGDTTLSNGRISFATGGLGLGTTLSIGGGTLQWNTGNTDDISSSRTVNMLSGGATFDTNGNDVTLATTVGNSGTGGLVKTGAGTLILAAANTYSGTTTVSGGGLSLADDSALGGVPGVATPGSLTLGPATLAATGTFTLSANRGIAVSSSASTINVAGGSMLTYGGLAAGAGILNVTGAGTLAFTTANTYNGGTIINTGATVNLSGNGVAGTGQLILVGGTLAINRTFNQGNIFVGPGQTGTIDGVATSPGISGLTGSGVITLITRSGGTNVGTTAQAFRFHGGCGAFAGTINLQSGTGTVNSFAAFFNGNGGGFDGNFSNATINMTNFARIGGVNNSTGNTITMGALQGDSTAVLSGADYVAFMNYIIGGKNQDTSFAGTINNGPGGPPNLTKTGIGSLTLSGSNTYTGTTTVNDGTLALQSADALGSAATGTTVAGGDISAKITVEGGITLPEPFTLNGRQGVNISSPSIVNTTGSNVLGGTISAATGGSNYNIQSNAGTLTIAGAFIPIGGATGPRILQLLGAGASDWSGSIQNGTGIVSVNCKDAGVKTLSGTNTYTGDTTVDPGSSLVLASTGQLRFQPQANNVSGKLTGGGTATLDGAFNIDLSAAALANGNTWTLVNVTSPTYGTGFTVPGFTKSGTLWTRQIGEITWKFDESTGQLGVALVGYALWVNGFGLTGANAAARFDFDRDGLENAIEFVIGGDPTLATEFGKLPTLTQVAGGMEFIYRRTDLSAGHNPVAEHDADLSGTWTPAVHAINGVTVNTSDEFYGPGVDKVTVFIPTSDPAHFVRLSVPIP